MLKATIYANVAPNIMCVTRIHLKNIWHHMHIFRLYVICVTSQWHTFSVWCPRRSSAAFRTQSKESKRLHFDADFANGRLLRRAEKCRHRFLIFIFLCEQRPFWVRFTRRKKKQFRSQFCHFFAIGKTLFILHGLKAARHDYEYTVKSWKIGQLKTRST